MECTKGCEAHFHHTMGRHLTNCDKYPAGQVEEALMHVRSLVSQGEIVEDIFIERVVTAIQAANEKVGES